MKRFSLERLSFLLMSFLVSSCASSYRSAPLEESHVLASLKEPLTLPDGLTLAQLQAHAVLRHPALLQLRAERGLADAAQIRSETVPDPELSLSPFWIVPEAALGLVASLRWELLPPGSAASKRGLAAALRESIDAGVASAEWEIAQSVRIAWIENMRAVRNLALSQRAFSLSSESRDFARKMVEQGVARGVDLALLDLGVAEAQRELVFAQEEHSLTQRRLAQVAGLPVETVWGSLSPEIPWEMETSQIPAGDEDEAMLARLPKLRETRAQYAIAERELEIAHLGASPRLALGPEFQKDDSSRFFGYGGAISIPIHDANRGGIAEARARREIAGKKFEHELFEARSRLARARAEEKAASAALSVHESAVIPRVREALAAAERAVEAGAVDLLVLLLARERAIQSERKELELRAARSLAIARLEAAFGPEPILNEGESK